MEQYSKYYYLFQDGGRYHIETNPLICSANQWTGFYMITASVLKGLISSLIVIITFVNVLQNHKFRFKEYGNEFFI